MSIKEQPSKALALLIPAGVIGISSALALAQAHAELVSGTGTILLSDKNESIRATWE